MAFNPVIIEKGLNAGFAQKMAEFYAGRELVPGLMAAVMGIESKSAYEKMGWIGAMAAVSEWLGELSVQNFEDYDYTIKNKDWAVTAPINENDYDDDQTGVLKMIPSLLAKRLLAHPEKLVSALLNNGTSALAYDGVAFFSNVSGARTFDNLLAGTGVTIAKLESQIEAARVAMAKFTDDKGEALNIKGNLIVCPVAIETNMRRIVQSNADPAQAIAGVFNPFNNLQVISDARLDAVDSDDWYLLATNEILKPFVFSTRQEGRPRMEKKNLTKTWIYSADYRGNAGYGLPHLAIKTVNT